MVLTGGNVGTAVVRVGDTVRRPGGFWSHSVHALLTHLNDVGYDAAPRSLGFDDLGRHVVEYVDGEVPMPFRPRDPVAAVRRVGASIREFHDASAGFTPPADARWNVVIEPDAEDLIIHHDLAPWNVVCGGDRWVIIDWDNAGPGSRLWDLAYAAHGFVPLGPTGPVSSRVLLATRSPDHGGGDCRRAARDPCTGAGIGRCGPPSPIVLLRVGTAAGLRLLRHRPE